jgi:hypothetical protein
MSGMSSPVALAVGATVTVISWAWTRIDATNPYPVSGDLGWVGAPTWLVVVGCALPPLWLLAVLVPRFGRGRLVVSWPEFPQRAGGRCTFHVGVSPGGANIDGVRVFLRCVRVRHRPLLPLVAWNARLAWAAEARLALNSRVGPETEVVAAFDVPASAPPTDLHADDSVRWEVLVLGTVGASDLAVAVPVPVYAK